MRYWNKIAERASIQSDIITLAEIVKEWGIKGEVKALPLSEKILTLLPGSKVCLMSPDGVCRNTEIKSIKRLGRHFVFSFFGIPDIESASGLRGSSVCISRAEIVLEENEFFCDQIIGLPVFTTEGEMLGKVAEILETGGNDVYVVRRHAKEYLLPAIKDVVREIDLDQGRIVVKPLPGLLD